MNQDKVKLQFNNGRTDFPQTQIEFQATVPSAGATTDQLASQISDMFVSDDLIMQLFTNSFKLKINHQTISNVTNHQTCFLKLSLQWGN